MVVGQAGPIWESWASGCSVGNGGGDLFLGDLDPASSSSFGNVSILVLQGTQDSFLLPWTRTSVALQSVTIEMSLNTPQSVRSIC